MTKVVMMMLRRSRSDLLQVKYADFESFKKLSTEVVNTTCCVDKMMILRSDLNIDERIIVEHSSSSNYQGHTKNGHVFIDESRRF